MAGVGSTHRWHCWRHRAGICAPVLSKESMEFFLSRSSNLGGNRGKDCGPVGLLTVRVLLERSLDPCYRPISPIALSINTYL